MNIEELITEEEFAEKRGVSLRTLQRERKMRISPPFIKLGRRIFYWPEGIEEWLLSQVNNAKPSRRNS